MTAPLTPETKPSSAYKARRWLEDCWAIAHPNEGGDVVRRRVDECIQVIEAAAVARYAEDNRRLRDQLRICISNLDMVLAAESVADEDYALIAEDTAVARAALAIPKAQEADLADVKV
jgi:hypothetical protein